MKARGWTPAEEAWLREVYPHSLNRDIAGMHAQEFPDRPRRTAKAINSRARRLHLRKADGFVRNPPVFWTPEKDEWFRSFVPGHTESEISAEHERIYGTPLTEGQIGNRKTHLGVRSGTVGGRFKKGNAGGFASEEHRRKFVENGKSTRFKPGEVHVAPSRERPIGYERVDADGFTWVKVRDSRIDGIQRNEPGHHNENYRMKHHIVYEQAHGYIPDGCNIVFADHDKRNFDPSNLVAVPRSIWSVISHKNMPYWDAESLGTCMLLAEVDRARYAAESRPRACRRCGSEFAPRFRNQRTCDACLGR